jgi:hypothetical protein
MSRRRLFTITSAVLLLGCLAMLWLWAVSYRSGSYFDWRTRGHGVELYTGNGRVFFSAFEVRRQNEYRFEGFRYGPMSPLDHWDQVLPTHHLYLGAFAAGWNDTGVLAGCGLILPYWFFVVVAGVIPAIWLRKHLNKRYREGGCEACGYNLTANTSGVCPECGTALPAIPEAVS